MKRGMEPFLVLNRTKNWQISTQVLVNLQMLLIRSVFRVVCVYK